MLILDKQNVTKLSEQWRKRRMKSAYLVAPV